jgi:hypothetical protein
MFANMVKNLVICKVLGKEKSTVAKNCVGIEKLISHCGFGDVGCWMKFWRCATFSLIPRRNLVSIRVEKHCSRFTNPPAPPDRAHWGRESVRWLPPPSIYTFSLHFRYLRPGAQVVIDLWLCLDSRANPKVAHGETHSLCATQGHLSYRPDFDSKDTTLVFKYQLKSFSFFLLSLILMAPRYYLNSFEMLDYVFKSYWLWQNTISYICSARKITIFSVKQLA